MVSVTISTAICDKSHLLGDWQFVGMSHLCGISLEADIETEYSKSLFDIHTTNSVYTNEVRSCAMGKYAQYDFTEGWHTKGWTR